MLGSAFSRPELNSIANGLTIPPIHVDHVAGAICAALDCCTIRGVIGVKEMRELIGWPESTEGAGVKMNVM